MDETVRRALWQIMLILTFTVAICAGLEISALGHPRLAVALGVVAFVWLLVETIRSELRHFRAASPGSTAP